MKEKHFKYRVDPRGTGKVEVLEAGQFPLDVLLVMSSRNEQEQDGTHPRYRHPRRYYFDTYEQAAAFLREEVDERVDFYERCLQRAKERRAAVYREYPPTDTGG